MSSLILRTATRFMLPLLLLFSAFMFLRGHDEPGGGFIAGLVAAAAFSLHAIAYDARQTIKALRVHPRTMIGIGLVLALAAGLVGPLAGAPFLTGAWATVSLPGAGALKLGTPLLFDLGVYVTVVGVVLSIILELSED